MAMAINDPTSNPANCPDESFTWLDDWHCDREDVEVGFPSVLVTVEGNCSLS